MKASDIPLSKRRTIPAIKIMLRDEGYSEEDVEKFITHHKESPNLYREFEKLALGMIFGGSTDLSAKWLVEELRRTKKLSFRNEYASWYSRIFVFLWPEFRKRFSFDKVGQQKQAA